MTYVLFPHLDKSRGRLYIVWLAAGAAALAILLALGLPRPALVMAAVLLPCIYLAYLYDADVGGKQLTKALLLSVGAGALTGVAVTVASDALLPAASPLEVVPSMAFFLGWSVGLPLVQEALKPLAVLRLRNAARANPTADGLSFGIAAGLGFAAAEALVRFSAVIGGEAVTLDWLPVLIGIAFVTPLLQAACTGLIMTALWCPGRLSRLRFGAAIWVALAAHVSFSAGGTLLRQSSVSETAVLLAQAGLVVALLAFLSRLSREAALEENEGRSPALAESRRRVAGPADERNGAFLPKVRAGA